VDRRGSKVALVDVGFSGTQQEILAAVFRKTKFRGLYAFHAASAKDPHPGSKHGYFLNLPSGELPDDRPLLEIPSDPSLMFACNFGFPIWEFTLEGPMTSVSGFAGRAPKQSFQSRDPHLFDNINPLVLDKRYTRGRTVDAVKESALLAVHDYAANVRDKEAVGASWRHETRQESARFQSAAFQWFKYGATSDEGLQTVLDSLVLRNDCKVIRSMRAHLSDSGVSLESAAPLWEKLWLADTLPKKQFLAAQVIAGGLDPTQREPLVRESKAATGFSGGQSAIAVARKWGARSPMVSLPAHVRLVAETMGSSATPTSTKALPPSSVSHRQPLPKAFEGGRRERDVPVREPRY